MHRKTRSTTPTTSSPLTRLRSDSIKSDPGIISSSQPLSPRSPTIENLSGLNSSLLQVTVDKSCRPGSPSVLETLSNSNSSSDKDSKKKGNSLKRCPCGMSSGGKAWILKCSSCTQMWHNSCANLKGNIPKTTIDQLDHWLCPWCFVSPYTAPKTHKSVKNSNTLTNIVSTDSLVSQIETTIKECIKPQNCEMLVSIQSSLDQLSQEIKEYSQKADAPVSIEPLKPLDQKKVESIKPEPTPKENAEPPFHCHQENFISDEESQALKSFLETQSFIQEGSRKVATYGTTYKYMGAKSTNPKPVPAALQPLIDKVNFSKDYAINQILVNKFDGPDASLPKHSDNEFDINPLSEIVTVSIGDPANIMFSEKHGDEKTELAVRHRSMYTMTRSSQNIYDHQIVPNPENTLRYSITMRCVHWTYLNSLYAVGDSNFGHIKFGEGKGTIGKSTPGKKEFAACVEDVIPEKTISYKNIVTMCGTNNLKVENANVREIYQKYKGKLEEIRKLSPRSNIFVCPVLPSRDHVINEKVFEFNRFLFDDLVHSGLRINLVRGLNVFLDKNYLLKSIYHDRRTDSDVLHINNSGYCALVKCIKTALFGAKTKKEHTGRQNSGNAWGTPRH